MPTFATVSFRAVWLLNAVRIVALIAIGTAGWPDVAMGGFHSQAGSLLFATIALGLVALSRTSAFTTADLAAPRRHVALPRTQRVDQTTGYLAQFLAIIVTAMLTGAMSSGDIDWRYPLRVCAAVAALSACRSAYRWQIWRWSRPSTFMWASFVLSSVVGAFHGSHWLAGTLAGLAFASALYWRGRIGDAVQAHAVPNGLLAAYAIATGHWSVMW